MLSFIAKTPLSHIESKKRKKKTDKFANKHKFFIILTFQFSQTKEYLFRIYVFVFFKLFYFEFAFCSIKK